MVKIVGKVDLDGIDSSTRPKTKGKNFRLKTYRKQFLRQWQETLKQERHIMERPTTFNGIPHEVVMSYHVPEDVIKEQGIDLNRTIVPILDINSLADYGTEDSEIGCYYASRSELALLFYMEAKHHSLMEGAEPTWMVPYKDDGDAEFIFDHFTLAWDKKTVFAVYKFNTTIS